MAAKARARWGRQPKPLDGQARHGAGTPASQPSRRPPRPRRTRAKKPRQDEGAKDQPPQREKLRRWHAGQQPTEHLAPKQPQQQKDEWPQNQPKQPLGNQAPTNGTKERRNNRRTWWEKEKGRNRRQREAKQHARNRKWQAAQKWWRGLSPRLQGQDAV